MHLYFTGGLLLAFVCSYLLTGITRHYLLRNSFLDIPNNRSSHEYPTPRGAGVVFVVISLSIIAVAGHQDWLRPNEALIFGIFGLAVALVGLIDDIRSINPLIRLIIHFVIVTLAVLYLGSFFYNFEFINNWHYFSIYVVIILGLAWYLNLYNFMDGIDGLAASQAIFVFLAGAILYIAAGELAFSKLLIYLASPVLGFLCWNKAPAKVFMGDSGSYFLGFMIGIFTLKSLSVGTSLATGWLILMAIFVTDATVTLFVRALTGKVVTEAHCSHAYQKAAKFLNSHGKTTRYVSLINICYLFPVALMVIDKYISSIYGLIIAYLPLVILALLFKGGRGQLHENFMT